MTPKEIIYQAIGEASMCWETTPTGIFDSTRAKEIGDRLWNQYEALESRIQKLEAVAEAAKDMAKRHNWTPGMGQCICPQHNAFYESIAELEQP